MRTLKKKGSSRSSMIISMSDVIFVTNRKLCREDFLTRIERLAQSCPKAVILREKDLSPEEYTRLAAKVMEICRARGTLCILHTFADTAEKLHAAALHLSMDGLRKLDHQQRKKLSVLGASCHSAAEASEAEALGCTYRLQGRRSRHRDRFSETDLQQGLHTCLRHRRDRSCQRRSSTGGRGSRHMCDERCNDLRRSIRPFCRFGRQSGKQI